MRRRPAPQPRVPLRPLLEALDHAELSLLDAAQRAGVDWGGLSRDRANNQVTVWKADRIAIRVLNRHPAEIWGDEWLDTDALNDPVVDLRIRAQHESWQLRHELRQAG